MRSFVALFLSGLLLICPVLCEAAGSGCVIPQDQKSCCPSDSPAPDHRPVDSDNCICAGAIPSFNARIPGIEAATSLLALQGMAGLLDSPLPLSLVFLTSETTRNGQLAWGDAIRVRALLQVFRC